MEDLDSRLLNSDQENDAAGELRERKRGQTNEKENNEAEETGEPKSLRERVMAARQALNLKERAKEKLEATITAPAKQGTSKLLQQAWINIIDSFGLTLIWINIHVFLRWVLGDKFFCKLGEEWLPKIAAQAGGKAGESAGKMIGLIEVMALLFIDLIILCAILVLLGIFLLICNIIQNPLSYIGEILGMIWDAVTGVFVGK